MVVASSVLIIRCTHNPPASVDGTRRAFRFSSVFRRCGNKCHLPSLSMPLAVMIALLTKIDGVVELGASPT